MFNLASILDIVRTAHNTAAAARDDWNDKAVDTEDWHIARQAYLAAEEMHAVSTRRLLRAVKVLSRTDTLYLYLNFSFLSAEQRELLNDSLRDNRHDRLLNTEAVPSNDFVALANAWKIERDRFSAGQELFDIGQKHDNIDPVIKHRADQLHPRGWGMAIRAFRITREMIAQARSLRAGCNLSPEERERAEQECERTAIDAVKSRAEARLTILGNELDRFLSPRINHAYLLNALMESILPVEVRQTSEDFDEDSGGSADHSPAGSALNQPEDSESFRKRLEEARGVVEALRTFIHQEPKPESNEFCVPVTTMIEGEEERSSEPESEAEPELDEEPLAEEESERVSDQLQDEVPTMTAAELEKLFNQ
jgi:hypothetical protein